APPILATCGRTSGVTTSSSLPRTSGWSRTSPALEPGVRRSAARRGAGPRRRRLGQDTDRRVQLARELQEEIGVAGFARRTVWAHAHDVHISRLRLLDDRAQGLARGRAAPDVLPEPGAIARAPKRGRMGGLGRGAGAPGLALLAAEVGEEIGGRG